MPRQPWTPSDREVRLLSEHLHYEVFMTFGLAVLLNQTQGTVSNQVAHNAQIEAFTIHVRQLHDFLWNDRSRNPSSRDAFASDYFPDGEWERLRPERPAILNDPLRRKVGWGVAHLTYGRAESTFADKQWNPTALARALAPAVICFADNVDPRKLHSDHLADLKPWAQSVMPPRAQVS
jgi:hypothetical protein